jgi:nucleoside phosphorylase
MKTDCTPSFGMGNRDYVRFGFDALDRSDSVPKEKGQVLANGYTTERTVPWPNMLTHDDITVGWICALPVELEASATLIDEPLPHSLPQATGDKNRYVLGRIGRHYVAMACLPIGQTGTNSAATVASHMTRTFKSLRFALMVGIAGGAPSVEHDIRLGDVVVSTPGKKFNGVVQYDFGKTVGDNFFELTGSLNGPPTILLSAVAAIQIDRATPESFYRHVQNVACDSPKFSYPGAQKDRLFKSDYDHLLRDSETCDSCDASQLESRLPRTSPVPEVHYGTVASGNQVMRHGGTREKLRSQLDILCFEMEAAGLMNTFPCLVIRGICDYSDSHKNKDWQPYASATAAAFAKLVLESIPPGILPGMPKITTIPWIYTLFSQTLVSRNKISLGRLVVNIRKPWQEFCPDSLEPPESEVDVSHQPRVHEMLHKSEQAGLYDKLRLLMAPVTALLSLGPKSEKTYTLLNSGNYFRQLSGRQAVRDWFELILKHKLNVYMIVGIHTVTDSGATEPSEKVFCFEYRKVKFKWFSSRTLDNAFLELGSRWKVPSSRTDKLEDLDDIVDVTLEENIEYTAEEVFSAVVDEEIYIL